MKKLTPELTKRHDELYGKLGVVWGEIDDVKVRINDMIQRELSDAIAEYNETIQEAIIFRDDVVAKMKEYADARSEDWVESDDGNNYVNWLDAWECANLEPIDQPDVIEIEGEDTAEESAT